MRTLSSAFLAFAILVNTPLVVGQTTPKQPVKESEAELTSLRIDSRYGIIEGTDRALVPVLFVPGKDKKFERLEVWVRFPFKQVKFEALDIPPAPSTHQVVKLGEQSISGDLTTLRFSVVSMDSVHTEIPKGLLTNLDFRVVPNSPLNKEFSRVLLELGVDAFEVGSSSPIDSAKLELMNGSIIFIHDGTILDVTCFFFTH